MYELKVPPSPPSVVALPLHHLLPGYVVLKRETKIFHVHASV